MKKMKKVMFLFFAGFLFSIIQSCCTDEYIHKWSGFEIQIIDSSGNVPVICDDCVINNDALVFRISMNDTVLFDVAQNFNVISECKATSCGEKWTRPHDMTSIIVKTTYNYSENFPAGSDITSLFKARIVGKENENYSTIEKVISLINSATQEFGFPRTHFDLYLFDNTCIGGQQKFEIHILLSDKTVFVKQTEDLLIK